MKLILFILSLLLTSCSLNTGPHVSTEQIMQPPIMRYTCRYSDHWYSWDRIIAYCDTFEKCNEACSKLEQK